MELTHEQEQAIQHGATVSLVVAETECVILRKDVYEKSLAETDPRRCYSAVLRAWDADDENPLQYEEYLRDV